MRRGLRLGLIITMSIICAGGIFILARYFGMKNHTTVESEEYLMSDFADGETPDNSEAYTMYKVDAQCVVKLSQEDLSSMYEPDSAEGGGYVRESGCVYKKKLINDSFEYGELTLEPTALDGYEYVGMSYTIGGNRYSTTETKIKKFIVTMNAAREVPNNTCLIYSVDGDVSIKFWYKKTQPILTFSVAPASGRLGMADSAGTILKRLDTTKISIDLSKCPEKFTLIVTGVDAEKYVVPSDNALTKFRDKETGSLLEINDMPRRPFRYERAGNDNFKIYVDMVGLPQSEDIELVQFLGYKGGKEQYEYRNQIITQSDPPEGGITSGDSQSINTVSSNITATPNAGYKFLYWSWYANGHYMTNKSDSFTASSTGVSIYTAHFAKATYKVELASVSPKNGGAVISGTGTYIKNASPEIVVKPNDGYKLSKWYYTNEKGVQYSGDLPTQEADYSYKISLNEITEDVYLHLEFESEKIKIKTVASPSDGGTAYIGDPPSTDTEADFERGSSVSLSAWPEPGYKFLYWSDSTGDQYAGTSLGGRFTLYLPGITQDTTYTAHFALDKLSVSAIATPNGAGQVKINDIGYADHIDMNVEADDDLMIYARETSSAYKFDHWEIIETGKENRIDKNNPLTVIDINSTASQIRYVAVFVPKLSILKVLANPQEGGIVLINGAYTELSVEEGDKPVLSATVNTGYYFDYWEDSKGNCFSGTVSYDSEGREVNTLTLERIQSDETYTAYFVPWVVNVSFLSDPYEAGTIDCNGHGYERAGSYDELGGWQLTLTARPDDPMKYRFDHWEDDWGNKYSNNPLELPEIRKDMIFTAVFTTYSKQDSGGIIVYAYPASGGHVSKVYNDDGSVTINATANAGYKFNCWKLGQKVISRKRETTITSYMDGDEYVAYFTATDGGIVRTGLVDEHFYRERRRMTSPIYTFDQNKLTFLAKAQISLDALKDDTPSLRNYAAYDNAAKYYEQHLIDNQFVFADGELVTTDGEKMPITYIPSSEEAFMDDALDFTEKKFGDRYETEIIAAVEVTMPSGFADGTRTYLWRNTGGKYKDNIYLLYATNFTDEYIWVTGVVDIDESIRFTVDDPGRMVRLAAVRVNIE